MKKMAMIISLLMVLSACSSTSDDAYKDVSETVKDEIVEDETETVEEDEMTKVPEYRAITAQEAKEMMTEDVLVLDVRSASEYADGHIKGALLHPHDEVLAGDVGPIASKDQVVLIYCRSGNRSGQAARYLVEAGYTNIYDFGGIIDWPYEIVK